MAYHVKNALYVRGWLEDNDKLIDKDGFESYVSIERTGGYLPVAALDLVLLEKNYQDLAQNLTKGKQIRMLIGQSQDSATSSVWSIVQVSRIQEEQSTVRVHIEMVKETKGWTSVDCQGEVKAGTSTDVIKYLAEKQEAGTVQVDALASDTMNWALGDWTPLEAVQRIALRYSGTNSPHDYLALACTLDKFLIKDLSKIVSDDFTAEFSLSEDFHSSSQNKISVEVDMVKRTGDAVMFSFDGFSRAKVYDMTTGELKTENFSPNTKGILGERTPTGNAMSPYEGTDKLMRNQVSSSNVHDNWTQSKLSTLSYGARMTSSQLEPIAGPESLSINLLDTILFRDTYNIDGSQRNDSSGMYVVTQKEIRANSSNELGVSFVLNRDVIGV